MPASNFSIQLIQFLTQTLKPEVTAFNGLWWQNFRGDIALAHLFRYN
ncbi:hypothetical protein MJH12_03725 [bacterium]|nr:hypothetical protein [bacterium]